MNRTAVLIAVFILAGAATAAAQSTAKTVRIQSEAIGLRTFSVLLPAAYEESERRYPVLYLLHGGGQDHTAFMARRDFARRARTVEMIVVMPAADRGGMPAAAVSRYEDFIARELVPYVDANFRTLGSAEGRAVAGLSMGGMLAAGTGLRFPHLFATVGAFSPAASRAAGQPPPSSDAKPYFYVSCGTLDSLLPASRQLVQVLEERALPHEYHEVPGFAHEWRFWDPQIDTFFQFLSTKRGWLRRPGA
jgi:enterochelin esterase-like enzyme